MQQLIDIFENEATVEYRGESYRVRDNGAVLRLPKKRPKGRPLDEEWTFGRQDSATKYMHLSGERVHRIVCTAYHGEPPTAQHVVDHIDTNRANNRSENLRWVTRLENILLNPISARRIELVYGSIEAFFADPARAKLENEYPDITWMRTVSKEEASQTRDRLTQWANSGRLPRGGALGEWLFGPTSQAKQSSPSDEYESLTPSVVQVRWKTPTEFPLCPKSVTDDALQKYENDLRFGVVFAKNDFYQSVVVQCSLNDDKLIVLTHDPVDRAMKAWAVAQIFVRGELFYHCSERQYFSLQGALKTFCELTDDDYNHSIDEYM